MRNQNNVKIAYAVCGGIGKDARCETIRAFTRIEAARIYARHTNVTYRSTNEDGAGNGIDYFLDAQTQDFISVTLAYGENGKRW